METLTRDSLSVTEAEPVDRGLHVLVAAAGEVDQHQPLGAELAGHVVGPDGIVLVNLSGRGDKDMETAREWFKLGEKTVEQV